jgi:hypothetical protein
MTHSSPKSFAVGTPELDTLLSQLRQSSSVRFDVAAHCFDAQRPFATSLAKYRTASCSRRAGKSVGGAALLIDSALKKAGCIALYITLTRVNAKRIMWGPLKRVNKEKRLGGEPKEAELRIDFPNGSSIYLVGANNKDEIEKFRGMPIAMVVLDEAQLLTNLRELVDEVLVPALMDYDGKVVLAGTPGPVPVGYFHECINSEAWEHFGWTVFDNPWIKEKSSKTPQQHLEEELTRRGVTVDEPSIQREWFGRWVYDPNALVFRYDGAKNHYDSMPVVRGDLEYVVAGDLGFDDADALCVLAWDTTRPDLYLIHEDVMTKQTITALGNKLKALVEKYNPLATVLDFGGLGKKIADELKGRWDLNVQAAEKERKLEHIELLNDDLRSGRFHAKQDSQFAKDCMLVEWDKSNPELPKISDRFHSDICFVSGTMVQTGMGSRPIEQIKPGEQVWTRMGLCEVLQVGLTGIHSTWQLETELGILVGTANHPVWTARGWVELSKLMPYDTVTGWIYQNSSNTKEESIEDPFDTRLEESGFTESFGKSAMANYHWDGSSITSTRTHPIMLSRIFRRFLEQLMHYFMTVYWRLGIRLQSGIALLRAASGIESLVGASWRSASFSNSNAMYVNALLRAKFGMHGDAAQLVLQRREDRAAMITNAIPAQSASGSSVAIAMTIPNTVHARVLRVHQTGRVEPVYNLRVDGANEYFAGGLLVHNCDAVLYGHRRACHWLPVPEKKKTPRPNTEEWHALRAQQAEAEADEALNQELEELAQRKREREDEETYGYEYE